MTLIELGNESKITKSLSKFSATRRSSVAINISRLSTVSVSTKRRTREREGDKQQREIKPCNILSSLLRRESVSNEKVSFRAHWLRAFLTKPALIPFSVPSFPDGRRMPFPAPLFPARTFKPLTSRRTG